MARPERALATLTYAKKPERTALGLPDWDDFRLLLAVVETGSFSRAATMLRLTQPTVSRRVERLERTIGARLVATLTLEGLRIVEQLHVAHNAISGAVESIHSPRALSEAVKLFTTDGVATYW